MIDIETLGTDSGAIILEIAAAEFDPASGKILREWSTPVDVLDSARLGMTADRATCGFHLAKTYAGTLRGATLWRALNALDTFLHLGGEKITVWAWGLDFETTLLKAACAAAGYALPWKYTEGRCARTVWKVAFPTLSPAKRPHRAADDVAAQVADLWHALERLGAGSAAQ